MVDETKTETPKAEPKAKGAPKIVISDEPPVDAPKRKLSVRTLAEMERGKKAISR